MVYYQDLEREQDSEERPNKDEKMESKSEIMGKKREQGSCV